MKKGEEEEKRPNLLSSMLSSVLHRPDLNLSQGGGHNSQIYYIVFLSYLLNYDIHHMFYPRRIPLQHDHAEWSQSLYFQRNPAAERPRASKLYGKSEAYHQRDQWDLLNVVMKKPLKVNNLTGSAFNETIDF